MNEQQLADAREVVIAGKLMMEGYTVSRPLTGASRYDLIAEKGGRMAKIQIKSLKLDGAYKDNQDRVFKVEAFSYNPVNKTKKPYSANEVDFIVGYRHDNDFFAVLPLHEFQGKMTCVIHSSEGGTRNEYMNSWEALDEFLS